MDTAGRRIGSRRIARGAGRPRARAAVALALASCAFPVEGRFIGAPVGSIEAQGPQSQTA